MANDGKAPVVMTPLMQWLMQKSEEKVRARKKGKDKADAKRGVAVTARPMSGVVGKKAHAKTHPKQAPHAPVEPKLLLRRPASAAPRDAAAAAATTGKARTTGPMGGANVTTVVARAAVQGWVCARRHAPQYCRATALLPELRLRKLVDARVGGWCVAYGAARREAGEAAEAAGGARAAPRVERGEGAVVGEVGEAVGEVGAARVVRRFRATREGRDPSLRPPSTALVAGSRTTTSRRAGATACRSPSSLGLQVVAAVAGGVEVEVEELPSAFTTSYRPYILPLAVLLARPGGGGGVAMVVGSRQDLLVVRRSP